MNSPTRASSPGLFVSILHEMGAIWLFAMQIWRCFFFRSGHLHPIINQVAFICFRSLPTVIFSGVFVGSILVLQINLILTKYDAQIFLGGLNTSTVIREVGPLIISFLLAGKIGAYTTAELGTMRVTEQIAAVECLGTDAIDYLIVPRFIGIVISNFILLLIGLLMSIGGSMVIASYVCGVNFLQFASSIPQFISMGSFVCAGIKSLIFGSIVGGVACFKGYTASGGAQGVGRAVTQSALYTNFYILIANFVSSILIIFTDEITQTISRTIQ